jgi:hypothetical protein
LFVVSPEKVRDRPDEIRFLGEVIDHLPAGWSFGYKESYDNWKATSSGTYLASRSAVDRE